MTCKQNNTLKSLFTVLCIGTAGAMAKGGDGHSFYDPEADPIPYNPAKTIHGPNYDLPPSPWKKAAGQRIDACRKADLNITVVDQNGVPVNGIPVHVELKRHDFYWGAVVYSDFLTKKHAEILKSYFLKYFNSAGFSMGLKPKQCPIPNCEKTLQSHHHFEAEQQLGWFKEHGIPLRGHTLAWEGKRFLADKLTAIYEDPELSNEEKGQRMFAHNAQHLDHTVKKWDVFCWDVVNEPRMNHLIDELLPETNTMVEWFRLADQARKKYNRDFLMYYNENQIISFVQKAGSFEENRDIYKARIREVLDAGVPIDGIGMQYRFRRYVAPEEVYRRLCDFEEFNLPFQATEFEVKPMTESESFSISEKKKMTAELLTVFFSHPNATGLWHWSFMDDQKGGSPDSLFSFDGQSSPEAEQWIKMMEDDFNTDETIVTSKKGTAEVRGFKGVYQVTLGKGPKAKTSIATLRGDTDLKLIY